MPGITQALIAGYGGNGGGGGGVPGVASTIIFADGADHNTSASDKWPAGGSPSIAASESGAHGRCYNNASARQVLAISPALATVSGGVRFKVTTDANDNFFRFQDSSTNQIGLRYLAGGSLQVFRGNAATQLAVSSAGLISLNTWYYAEITVTINNTTGSFTAKLYSDAGTLLATLTDSNVDTQDTANASTNRLDAGGTNADTFVEDIWLDNTGALYGPLRVETLYPTGDGALAQWTRAGTDSGANWSQLDEAQNNDSTDYLREGTDGEINLCTFQARSLPGAIHAVQVTPVCTREGAVAGIQARVVARIAGTNYFGPTFNLTNAFIAQPHCFGVNPATGLAWNSSELVGAQFGLQKVAGSAGVDVFLTQLVLEVVTAI